MKNLARIMICLVWTGVLAAAALPAGEEPARAPTTAAVTQIRQTIRQLRQENMLALPPAVPHPGLREATRNLRAMEFSPKPKAISRPQGPVTTAPSQTPAPSAPVRPKIPSQVLAALASASPEAVADPVGLADALYLSKQPQAARVFYEHALKKAESDDDKAWLLFQIANCRRQKEPAKASEIYQKLLTDYPDSPWSAVAKAQDALITWRQGQEIEELFAEQSKKPAPGTGAPVR